VIEAGCRLVTLLFVVAFALVAICCTQVTRTSKFSKGLTTPIGSFKSGSLAEVADEFGYGPERAARSNVAKTWINSR